MRRHRKHLAALTCMVALAACSRAGHVNPTPTMPPPGGSDAGTPAPGTSARTDLRWKRFRVLERDLSRALALAPDEVCQELGAYPCATSGPVKLTEFIRARGYAEPTPICAFLQGGTTCTDGPLIDVAAPRGVHVVALGGNDPFFREQYEPLPEPNVITPLALERVVLSACARAVDRDRAGPPKVFTQLRVDDTPVTSTTPGLREQIQTLYRRLLARDAALDEVTIIAEMADGPTPTTGGEMAKLACFAIATTTEFVWQ